MTCYLPSCQGVDHRTRAVCGRRAPCLCPALRSCVAMFGGRILRRVTTAICVFDVRPCLLWVRCPASCRRRPGALLSARLVYVSSLIRLHVFDECLVSQRADSGPGGVSVCAVRRGVPPGLVGKTRSAPPPAING